MSEKLYWLHSQTRYELEGVHDRVAEQIATTAPLRTR